MYISSVSLNNSISSPSNLSDSTSDSEIERGVYENYLFYYERGNFSQAIEYLNQVIENPFASDLCHDFSMHGLLERRADCEALRGNYGSAIEDYKEAIRLSYDLGYAIEDLCRRRNICYLLMKGEHDGATYLSIGAENDPIAALVLFAFKKYQKGMTEFPKPDQSLADSIQNPNLSPLGLAHAYYEQRQYLKASAILTAYLDGSDYVPDDQALMLRGTCHALMGDFTAALIDYDRADAIWPYNHGLSRGLVHYLRGDERRAHAAFDGNRSPHFMGDYPEKLLLRRLFEIY